MKKFIWIIIILLLLWLGFLYVVKNPELPISQKILTTLGMQSTVPQELTWQISTGIDLTNCVSYFDGCNNCSVKDGKPDACTLMYCETPTEPKCLQYATENNEPTWSTVPAQTGETTPSTAITINQWYLTEAYTIGSKNYLKIDYTEDGPQWPGWAPEIINNNPLIRTFEVADTATFEVLKNGLGEWPKPVSILRNEFTDRVNKDRNILNPDINNPIYYGAGNISIVKIDHDSQKIYKVVETYRP
jgi:hypothetical protein